MPRKPVRKNNIRKDTIKIKKVKSNPHKGVYRGLPHDSLPEKYTMYWMFELEEAGFIEKGSIQRSDSYLLFNTVSRNWIEKLKTKSNPKVETLLAAHLYTPDFVFKLTEAGKKCPLFSDIKGDSKLRMRSSFNLIHQEGVVHIETKGTKFRTFNASTSTEEKFSVDNKWCWEKHGIYTNMFVCDIVFPKTFTPRLYLQTDITKQSRKIHWHIRSLQEYLRQFHPSTPQITLKRKRA